MRQHNLTWKELVTMMRRMTIKQPGQREVRKHKRSPSLLSAKKECEIGYLTLEYLKRIGVPTDNLPPIVKIKILPLDRFIIIDGKEDKSHSSGVEGSGE